MICHGPILAQRDNLAVLDCRVCGYAHLDWFPTQAELDAYYSGSFWQQEKQGWREIHEGQREWLDARNEDWLELLERHAKPSSLLDVGAGWGFFLKSARDRDWEPDGIEPSTEAIAYMHKTISGIGIRWMNVSWDNFDGLYSPTHKWGCVSALWLIEHLPNPLEFLNWCKSHLVPGGVLLLTLPNEWSDAQYRANEVASNKNFFLHLSHLNYFSQSSIANLLGRAGFRVVEQSATYAMERFIIGGMDYTNDPPLGQKCHALIEQVELGTGREDRLVHYGELARRGIGRDLVIVAKAE